MCNRACEAFPVSPQALSTIDFDKFTSEVCLRFNMIDMFLLGLKILTFFRRKLGSQWWVTIGSSVNIMIELSEALWK
jgi:hypothetical protein